MLGEPLKPKLELAWGLLKAGVMMAQLKPQGRRTVADVLEELARRYPDEPCILFENRRLSFAEFNARANRVAHWALEAGLGQGDVVALLMGNRAEYPTVWAGLAKLGVVTALINTNLSGRVLRHAIETAAAKRLIVGAECLESLATLGADARRTWEIAVASEPGATGTADDFEAVLAEMPTQNPERAVRAGLRTGDPLFYIYTSGTTGNPKAARFSHLRFLSTGGMGKVLGLGPGDVMYCALPLYHTAGGAMALASAWMHGAAVAIRRRFSAREFWEDVRRYDATAFQYIGEFCRYLLNQPVRPDDGQHRLRYAIGNGLRPDIWEEFRDRFRIPRIVEFYGATEGNAALINFTGEVGSVGKMPPRFYSNVRHIRYDVEKDAHLRDERGFCIACPPSEVGELIGRIPESPNTAAGRFEGYTSREDTERKILRNVFARGDAWFRSGDLLRSDARGHFYFVDRIGDTFRWKGENVSTQEVAEELSSFPDVEMVNVYGVEVPRCDGRAGMVALLLRAPERFDARAFYTHATRALPTYAAPLFLRIQRDCEVTGTFKIRKVDLQQDGFDPARSADPLFLRDDSAAAYVPLTPETFEAIRSGRLRL